LNSLAPTACRAGRAREFVVELLSKREREVLRLVSAMLSAEEIGSKMCVYLRQHC
jgi:DNA-binding CsgD family transcriptional regulator